MAKLHPLIAWKVTISLSDEAWKQMSEEELDSIVEKLQQGLDWDLQIASEAFLSKHELPEHLKVTIEEVEK
jgi:hypothetical protein